MFDIVPDIHGQADKLDKLIANLGWQHKPSGWIHPEPNRQFLFLGDFIDRGPDNSRVVSTVRSLMDGGKAKAVMGNHELNAIHFHTVSPEGGEALRKRDDKNCGQHKTFLNEFPIGAAATCEVIEWMKRLPLYFENDNFRAVHACWNEPTINELRKVLNEGILNEEQLVLAANKKNYLYHLIEVTAKGPETRLPPGHSFKDKDGNERSEIRAKWWKADANTWSEIAMSVPKPEDLPSTDVPQRVKRFVYPISAKPVFFGHYWLDGQLILQAPNALCLDYSAGKNGPLISYRMDETDGPITLAFVSGHS